jgi:hypothetical protein
MPDTDLDRAFDTLVADVERVVAPPGADRTRTTVRLRRARGAALALLLALAVVGGVTVAIQGGDASREPQPAPPVTRTDESSLGGDLYPASAVDGHWRTRHLSPVELRGLLVAAGRTDVLARWESHGRVGSPRLTLAVNAVQGRSLWLGVDARPYLIKLDRGSFTELGHRVVLTRQHTSTPTAWLRATVTGARLDLVVVDSAWPSRNGVSGVEQARALYSSLPFTRFVSAGHY